MNEKNLYDIVARASSLYERMNNSAYLSQERPEDKDAIDERLAKWKKNAAKGDERKFQRRIEWEGWNIKDIRKALGAVSYNKKYPLPDWADILAEIIDSVTDFKPELLNPSPLNKEKPLPFDEILLPVIWVARRRLFKQLNIQSFHDEPIYLLTESAYGSLEQALLQRLVQISNLVLNDEFLRIKPKKSQFLACLLEKTVDNVIIDKTYYNKFVHNFSFSKTWLNFFYRYPVLAKLFSLVIKFWVEMTVSFLQRLSHDFPLIQINFFQEKINKVITLDFSVSDSHQHGQSTIILTFDAGSKLVYKPHNIELSIAYNNFLLWCNNNNSPLLFKIVQTLDRVHYGWEEFVDHNPCENESAAKRFYERSGMLLCVLYVLCATDCHFENVIASGEHLVLVDTETILHPLFTSKEDKLLMNSVLQVGLLPCWEVFYKEKIAYDMSGFGCPIQLQGNISETKWKFVNTDLMLRTNEIVNIEKGFLNIPFLNKQPLSANSFVHEIESGFVKMYRFLKNNYKKILQDTELLKNFRESKIRFIWRKTYTYFMLLQQSYLSKELEDGADRSIVLDQLCQVLLDKSKKPKTWPILSVELSSLEEMDIPYFIIYPSQKSFPIGRDIKINNFFEKASYKKFLYRLSTLNDIEMNLQSDLIRGSFCAQVLKAFHAIIPSQSLNIHKKNNLSNKILSPDEIFDEVENIALNIEKNLIRDDKESIRWIAPCLDIDSNRIRLQCLGYDLYDGNVGIALFLAVFSEFSGNSKFKDLSIQALIPILNNLRDFKQKLFFNSLTIGGLKGLASLIYGLVKISQVIKLPELISVSMQLAEFISFDFINKDKNFDLMSGTAGTILAMLSLYEITGNKLILQKIIQCGEYLLEQRTFTADNQFLVWKRSGNLALTGCSHGQSGIAYALLRLYKVTNDLRYLTAAKIAISFEQSLFSDQEKNWPCFQSDGDNIFQVSWCHGAPGIILSRIASLAIFDEESWKEDIQKGLDTIANHRLDDLDILCCGNMGRIGVLWFAIQNLKDIDKIDIQNTIFKKISYIILRAKKNNNYRLNFSYTLNNIPSQFYNPSLYIGSAGIGYQLLQIISSNQMPNLLLLS